MPKDCAVTHLPDFGAMRQHSKEHALHKPELNAVRQVGPSFRFP